jgi:hypothetical protein
MGPPKLREAGGGRVGEIAYRSMASAGEDLGKPIHVSEFWHDGRGPELRRVLWNSSGTSIHAIEYVNPDWTEDADERHVVFKGPQVVQITPEEVIAADQIGSRYRDHRPAAMFDLGRDAWVRSFTQTHLSSCRHIQMLFYDELIDVICEDVECATGPAPAPP